MCKTCYRVTWHRGIDWGNNSLLGYNIFANQHGVCFVVGCRYGANINFRDCKGWTVASWN
jgi:hypothetical protein